MLCIWVMIKTKGKTQGKLPLYIDHNNMIWYRYSVVDGGEGCDMWCVIISMLYNLNVRVHKIQKVAIVVCILYDHDDGELFDYHLTKKVCRKEQKTLKAMYTSFSLCLAVVAKRMQNLSSIASFARFSK